MGIWNKACNLYRSLTGKVSIEEEQAINITLQKSVSAAEMKQRRDYFYQSNDLDEFVKSHYWDIAPEAQRHITETLRQEREKVTICDYDLRHKTAQLYLLEQRRNKDRYLKDIKDQTFLERQHRREQYRLRRFEDLGELVAA